jgi:hypothetical protein
MIGLLITVAAVTVSSVLATTLELQFPGRAVLVIAFLVAVPGIPVALAIPLPSRLVQLSLGVSISLASTLLMSVAQLYGGWWTPEGGQVTLAVVGLMATGPALWAVLSGGPGEAVP